jgi:hypothetical protein
VLKSSEGVATRVVVITRPQRDVAQLIAIAPDQLRDR